MIAISVSACSFPIGMGLAGLVLPPVLVHLGLRAALLTDTIPAGLALLLFLASYREPAHVAPVPGRFSLPSRPESVLLLVAGLVWTAYTSAYSAFLSYPPASLSGHGYGVPLIGLVMTIATWGNVPATMLGSGLAARFDRFRVSLVGSLSLAIGMAGSAMFGWPVAWALVLGVLGSLHPGVIMAIGMLSARRGAGCWRRL
jgi:cyanate permease